MGYHIFLTMLLRARSPWARVELRFCFKFITSHLALPFYFLAIQTFSVQILKTGLRTLQQPSHDDELFLPLHLILLCWHTLLNNSAIFTLQTICNSYTSVRRTPNYGSQRHNTNHI